MKLSIAIMIIVMALTPSIAIGNGFDFSVNSYGHSAPHYMAEVYYSVKAEDSRVNDVSMKMHIPELDLYHVSPEFNILSYSSYSSAMLIDIENAEPGAYLARFVVSNDDYKKVKYRHIFID